MSIVSYNHLYYDASSDGEFSTVPVNKQNVSMLRLLTNILLPVITLLLWHSTTAYAYIGPGAGLSLLGSIWTLLVVILLAIAAILFWPIKFLLRKQRKKLEASKPQTQPNENTDKNTDSAA